MFTGIGACSGEREHKRMESALGIDSSPYV